MLEIILLSVTLLFVAAVFIMVLVNCLLRRGSAAPDQAVRAFAETTQAEFRNQRDEFSVQSRHLREELDGRYKNLSDSLLARMHENLTQQHNQFIKLEARFESLEKKLVEQLSMLDANVRDSLEKIRHDNTVKLEDMRKTVDEKLQSTLEKRLGDSFKLVSERLEQVHKGLGEMQTLAAGVGDLKKALTNVKTRGVMGEHQLESILEQLLTPEQYRKNVSTRPGSRHFVEFAIVLPGRDDSGDAVLLPIDAKFPTEDYNALQEAYEKAEPALIDKFKKQISARIVSSAKDIRDKYIEPPHTTDFGIMFLPTEGLFAEVLRDPGLMESLQRDYHVTIAGPTTLSAFLNSLQMGFRTLAIEKRSSEVWKILGAVKTEFGKFGDVLEKTRKKLEEASNVIEGAGVRSRAIERKLRDVAQLPAAEAQGLLALDDAAADIPEEA